jgi:hypothetical protein
LTNDGERSTDDDDGAENVLIDCQVNFVEWACETTIHATSSDERTDSRSSALESIVLTRKPIALEANCFHRFDILTGTSDDRKVHLKDLFCYGRTDGRLDAVIKDAHTLRPVRCCMHIDKMLLFPSLPSIE